MPDEIGVQKVKGTIDTGEVLDIVIVGAGISGINTAYRLQTELSGISYAIFEGRDAIGGTWDFFKYPGLRSDSDLFTFGFSWRPWVRDNPIADAKSILEYLRDSVQATGIDRKIRFNSRVQSANWSTKMQRWELTVASNSGVDKVYSKFLVLGTGYYDYEEALPAGIPSMKAFNGLVVHTQFWPEGLDYTGKRVVCVGSGATAITLLPVLAEKALSVTMLQRSPSYIMSIPNNSSSSWLWKLIPRSLEYRLNRIWFMVFPMVLYYFCRMFPKASRNMIRNGAKQQLPSGYPVDPDFTPRYDPFDQRVCFAPDGDFYSAIRNGKARVITDTMKEVVHDGIILNSGTKIEADIIITATGLKLQVGGKVALTVDGNSYLLSSKLMWRNAMVQDLPNAVFILGYTMASWTLGADATAFMLCRLLRGMRRQRLTSVVPHMSSSEANLVKPCSLFNLNSTYVLAAANVLPKVGDKGPWRRRMMYFTDLFRAKYGDMTTGLQFLEGNVIRSKVKI